MLKDPAKRQDLIQIHVAAFLTVCAFWQKAGWPSYRSIRLVRLRRINWQDFFITSAFQTKEKICNIKVNSE